jgi:cobalt-zinc-cadmium efflux system membrane fusion protein
MKFLVAAILFLFIFSADVVIASGELLQTEHLDVKGPQGGKLLKQDEFAIEITIYESGIPPEMRLYAYANGKTVDPSELQVKVTLDRLGGVQDKLSFSVEQGYLVSEQSVVEPHSFDVSVEAKFENKVYQWRYSNHEGRAEISPRLMKLSGIETEIISSQSLKISDTLYGVISVPQNKIFKLHAPYQGLVKKIHVQVGDKVTKGQRLATLLNTQTLQSYYLDSPVNAEVSDVLANVGDKAEQSILIELIDLSQVWVNLSAFPENIERLAVGQKVEVYDLHHHKRVSSTITYIAPQMTGGHIARARAVIDNLSGHWRPGMHIKADVEIESRKVASAIKTSALQTFRDMPVVFAKFGNTFEVRMLQLGESDGEYIEVLGGIKVGTEYVTGNSFLLKADVLKDGASHDH